MSNIIESIAEIKREIIALKTTQQTKADSYKWYLYITPNLEGPYGKSWVEFIPENGDYENTFVYCGVREQYTVPPVPLGQVGISLPDNPYKAIARNASRGTPYSPDDYCYIYFYTNQKGFLKITPIEE